MNIINKLKYKFSEAYRIRIGCGLRVVRSNREYKALIEFCREQLCDVEHMKLNPDRKRVYETTIMLHECWESDNSKIIKFKLNGRVSFYNEPYDFIDDHVGYYWS